MSDRIFGGLGLLFSVFYIWQATKVPDSFMVDVIGPRTFPYLLGGAMVLTCVAIVFKPDAEPHWPGAKALLEVAAAVVALWIYSIMLPELGFVFTTAIVTAVLTWRLGTSPVASLIFGVLASLSIFVVFKLVLGLSLARGPWGF